MRVLAVRQDNNGDVILAGPALRAIAAHAELTLLCGPGGEAAARLLPGISRILVARAEWIEGSPHPVETLSMTRLVRELAAYAFDRAVIFTSFHQSALPTALLLRMAGIPWIGAYSVDYPGSLLDVRASIDDDVHEVRRGLALSRACGFDPSADDDDSLTLMTLPTIRHIVGDTPYVVVQATATVPARALAPQRLYGVVRRLAAQGQRVIVTGAAADYDLVESIVENSDALNLCGRTTFAEFAAVIRDAQVLLVGNSSGLHIASAVGTPVVTIFAPTIPAARFAPWRVPYVLLGDQTIACAGCRARVCPIEGQPCIGAVTDDEVLAAIATLSTLRSQVVA